MHAYGQDFSGIGLWGFVVVQLCETVPRRELTVYRMQGKLVTFVSLLPTHSCLSILLAVCAGVFVNMWAQVFMCMRV